jgi:hypothetical protein
MIICPECLTEGFHKAITSHAPEPGTIPTYICSKCRTVFRENGVPVPFSDQMPAPTLPDEMKLRIERLEREVERLKIQLNNVDRRTQGQIKFGGLDPYKGG